MTDTKKMARRRHSAELKALVLRECAEPGASVASVAMSHGINANVVHRWRRIAGREGSSPMDAPAFVPLALPPAQAVGTASIRIELRRGATIVSVDWPVAASAECAAWLREMLH